MGATHGSPPEGRDGVAAASRRRVIRAKRGIMLNRIQAPGAAQPAVENTHEIARGARHI